MNDQATSVRPTAKRVLVALGLFLLFAIAAFALRSWWMRPSSETPDAERPLDLPVEQPTLSSMDDVADMMAGKPLPSELADMSLPLQTEDDHVYGETDAAFSVVQYSNFGNAYAALLHSDLRMLVDESNGTVNWIVRHYPVTDGDTLASQAAECAYFEKNHEGFWSFFDDTFTFRNPTSDTLVNAAAALGMDRTSFQTCLDENYTRDRVLADLQNARLDAKVTVAPSYVVSNNVNGELRLVEGINTIDYIEAVLDDVR